MGGTDIRRALRGRGAASLLAAVIACCLLGAAPGAFAAPPVNDNFADAEDLGSGATAAATGTNVDATKELAEPNHVGDPGGASVWYRWTAPSTGSVRVSTCSSDFDTLVGVYSGPAVALLAAVASNNDFCGQRSKAVFNAVQGVEYRIAVDGRSTGGVAAQGVIELNLTPDVPPPNDDFDAAADLGSISSGSAFGHNFDASKEAGEPSHAGGNVGGASIWYQWTAPESGLFEIETCGSAPDTLLAVYTGSQVDSLSKLRSNDDGCGEQSRLVLTATAATVYRIAVDGANFLGTPSQGEIDLAIVQVPDQDGDGVADEEDNCPEVANPGQANNDGDGAGDACDTDDDNDTVADESDNCPTFPNASQADNDGDGQGDPCDPDDDNDGDLDGSDNCATVPNPDQADNDGDGQGDACDPDDDGDGVEDESDACPFDPGSEPDGCPPPPPNDDFADAVNLGNASPVMASGDNFFATKEAGEPDHGFDPGGASVWYRWTPSASGQYVVNTCGSGFDTLLGVYTGSAVASLTTIAGNDDDESEACGLESRVTIDAIAGTTYRIAVDGFSGGFDFPEEGFVELSITPVQTTGGGGTTTGPGSSARPSGIPRTPSSRRQTSPRPAPKAKKCRPKKKLGKAAKKPKCKKKGKKRKK